jgi:membrane protein DedA with SNARE-associated domain
VELALTLTQIAVAFFGVSIGFVIGRRYERWSYFRPADKPHNKEDLIWPDEV